MDTRTQTTNAIPSTSTSTDTDIGWYLTETYSLTFTCKMGNGLYMLVSDTFDGGYCVLTPAELDDTLTAAAL